MAVTSDLPNKLRWTWNQFTFVVATEGPRVALERALGLSGLAVPHVEPEEALVGPPRAPLSLAAAARWPVSLVFFGAPEPASTAAHVLALATELGIPTRTADPGTRDPGAVELASALVVAGAAAWPHPVVLAEAARLRQAIILLAAADAFDTPGFSQAVRRSRAIVVDSDAAALALRSRHPGGVEVRVIAPDARAEELEELIGDLALRVP